MQNIRLLPICLTLFGLVVTHATASKQAILPAPPPVASNVAEDRFANLFMPFRTEIASLSPDGRYIAYTLRKDGVLSVLVIEIEHPEKAIAQVAVISDDQSTPLLDAGLKEKKPAEIRWLHWVTPSRLVVVTNRNYPWSLTIGFVTKWLNCSGDILAFDADGQNAKILATPNDVSEYIPDPTYQNSAAGDFSRMRVYTPDSYVAGRSLSHDPKIMQWRNPNSNLGSYSLRIPRHLEVMDFCEDDPNAIIVKATGIARSTGYRTVERYKLNINTGSITSLFTTSIPNNAAALFDCKGTPRICVVNTTQEAFPHYFTYDSGTFFKRWKRLDTLAGYSPTAGFSISPQNYFGERAVPLGFDKDPNLVYIASNISRDTYGLYIFDIRTGKKVSMLAEDPLHDLFTPGIGVYPDTNGSSQIRGEDSFLAGIESLDAVSTSMADIAVNNATDNTVPPETQAVVPQNDDQSGLAVLKLAIDSFLKNIEIQIQKSSSSGSEEKRLLVYDRFQNKIAGIRIDNSTNTACWKKAELQKTQDELGKVFLGKSVQLEEWDNTYQRFLIKIIGPTDSGAFYIYNSVTHKIAEFVQCAPWLNRDKLNEISEFDFRVTDGHQISGTITFPKVARSVPVPAIVICPTLPWERINADFRPEPLAITDMGFAVIQINSRGAWGFGIKHREEIRNGYEEAQIGDIVSALDFLAKRYAINPKRIALIGKQHGGFLALRALQLYPEKFRCAVAIDTVLDIFGWISKTRWTTRDSGPALVSSYFGDAERLKQSPLLSSPEKILKPVLLFNYRGESGKPASFSYANAEGFVATLNHHDVPAKLQDLSDDYITGLPHARAEVFRKIEDFLNTYIYDFKVQFGELKQLKDN